MKKSVGLILVALFMSQGVFAQEVKNTISTKIETKSELRKKSPWSLQLDLNPIFKFNGSYGLSVIFDINDRASAEGTVAHQETGMSQEVIGLDTLKSVATSQAYGVRLNFYPFSNVQEGGFYTSLAGAQTDLKFRQNIPGNEKELNDQITTRQIFAGYHFRPRMNGGLQLTSRVGAGYGNGNKYVVRSDFAQYEAKDTALLDASFLISY